jgi:hypothetical protein
LQQFQDLSKTIRRITIAGLFISFSVHSITFVQLNQDAQSVCFPC